MQFLSQSSMSNYRLMTKTQSWNVVNNVRLIQASVMTCALFLAVHMVPHASPKPKFVIQTDLHVIIFVIRD